MKEVNYTLLRFHDTGEATGGILFNYDMNFVCFTVEDQYQDKKVSGETRIPSGKYEIKKREFLSGLTKIYRKTREWFDWHLELQDVPNFEYVYIHNGVDSGSSEGCILIGDGILNKYPEFQLWDSKNCFEDVWKEISSFLGEGYKVTLTIRDEDFIKQPF